MYNIDKINAGTLALLVARSGAKLKNTSLSTGAPKHLAYDIVYIAQLDFGNSEFCSSLLEYKRMIGKEEPLHE